jgi:hypothetical protein
MTVTAARRPLRLSALLAINGVAVAMALVHAPSPYAMLMFCGGNGCWIVMDRGCDADATADSPGLTHLCFAVLTMTLCGFAVALLTEPVGAINQGLAWDGRHYAAMYSFFATGSYVPISPEFPYTQRVGLPFLAAHLPFSPRSSFLVLHCVFWSLTMVVFALCCRTAFGIRHSAILFAVLWLQVAWESIPRAVASYSYGVDSAALFFMQLWMLLLLCSRRTRWLLPLCAIAGALFKETIPLLVGLSLLTLVALWILPRFRKMLPADLAAGHGSAVAPLVGALVGAAAGKWVAVHALPDRPPRGSELDTIRHWVIMRGNDPVQLLRYIAAGFAVYGGFALLRVAIIGKPVDRSAGWPAPLAAGVCALYLAVCFVAGSDLTRFAYMAFPFAMPLLLSALDEVPNDFGLLALLLGFPAAHAFTAVPPLVPGHELPNMDLRGGYSWMMEYAHPALVGAWIAWWLACILLLRSIAFASRWRLTNDPPRAHPL